MAHEENSSSQNVNPVITALKTGASGESIEIRLSDGSSFFIGINSYTGLDLYRDKLITPAVRESLEYASQLHAGSQKALQLAARREHSRSEMMLKLQQRGYPEEIIEKILDKMQRLGIIDDRRFAEVWLRSRLLRKDEGPVRLRGELLRRGVDAATAGDVLNEILTPELILQKLEKATEKVLKKCGGDQNRFIRMLKTRGFEWSMIKKISIDKFINYYNNLH